MSVEQYLNQIRLMDVRISQKVEEKETLQSIATSTGSMEIKPDKIQTSISLHKSEENIVKYIELEKEIDALIDAFVILRDRIINEIHKLNNAKYEELLYLKYVGKPGKDGRIHYFRLEEIACIMTKSNGDWYSYKHIERMHREAKKKFSEICGGNAV